MHILLVRFSSMGDVVLQTATVNWLKSLLGPKLRLTYVTSQEFVSLTESHPHIAQTIGFNRRGGDTWKDLVSKIKAVHREHPIDLILDLHATLRSFRLKGTFWTIPNLTVDKRRWERFFLTKIKSVRVKRFFDRKAFGLEPQVMRIIKDIESIFGDNNSIWRTQDFRGGLHRELTSLGSLPEYPLPHKYIVLAPSASFAPKRWHTTSFVELARKLLAETSYDLVILAGPADTFCEVFNDLKDSRVHNLQGKTSLSESMSVLQGATLCIGNDSGMNHIAEAYGVPCVTLFGPTDPRFGFAPHGEKSSYISKELWCKPCSTTGKSPCYRERHFCMEMITPDEVLACAKQALEVI